MLHQKQTDFPKEFIFAEKQQVKENNMEYYIGQIFDGIYPPEAANWCNQNNAYIEEIGERRYEIKAVPPAPAPTKEEQSKKREAAYIAETDPIQTHIDRLKDGKQTPEIVVEIEQLRIERDEKIAAIKERYPYPTDPIIEKIA
jgi:hypothetical protein